MHYAAPLIEELLEHRPDITLQQLIYQAGPNIGEKTVRRCLDYLGRNLRELRYCKECGRALTGN